MDRRYPRCGVAAATAAAAALALLTNVADVQGFAFQLPLPAKQAATAAATSQKRAFVGGGWGASARGVHASGAQVRTSTPTSRVARNTRHARTAVRYEEEDARLTKSTCSLLMCLLSIPRSIYDHRFSRSMCNLSVWEGWQAGNAAAAAAAAVALGVSAIDPCRIGDTLGGLLSCTGYVAGSRKAAKIAGGVSEAKAIR